MIKGQLKTIQTMVNGTGLEQRFESISIEGVTIDSRNVTKGNLYIPMIGQRADGHDFFTSALDAGASAILWQKDRPNPPTDVPLIFVENTLTALQQLAVAYKEACGMKVVGITGSNGKTSTKDILASILATTYKVHKTPGNFNSEFGMPLTLLMAPVDTEIAVLEMGMRGLGQIKLLSQLAKPDVAVITCIGEAHIEELGSRHNISIAKYEITSGLSDDGLFVYHGDEPLLHERINESRPNFQMISFGEDVHNPYHLKSIDIDNHGMKFSIPDSDLTFHLSVLGKHNVMNSLAAMAVARHFDLTFDAIKKGLAQVEMSKMRMEIRHSNHGLMIIDDTYNSSPTSVRATLDLLYTLTGYNKKIVVLADMLELGEHSVNYHKDVGEAVDSKKVDVLFTYGPLSKYTSETSNVLVTQHFDDKIQLAQTLFEVSAAGDVCLVKGSRGMALEDVIHALCTSS